MAWMLGYIIGIATLLWCRSLESISAIVQCVAAITVVTAAGIFCRLFLNALQCVSTTGRRKASYATCLLFLAGLTTGTIHSLYSATNAVSHKLPLALDGQTFLLNGVIRENHCSYRDDISAPDASVASSDRAGLPTFSEMKTNKRICRFLIDVSSIDSRPLLADSSGVANVDISEPLSHLKLRRVRLSYYGPDNPGAGDYVSVVAKLKSLRGFANPGSFDTVRYLYAKRIDAQGYIKSLEKINPADDGKNNIASAIRLNRLTALNPLFNSLEQGTIISALLLGEKQALTTRQKKLFEQTGTIHLMAISGLHIGIAAGMGLLLSKLLCRLAPRILLFRPAVWLETLCAVPMAVFYAVLAGLSVPTQRALIMICVLLVFRCFKVEIAGWVRLLLALCLILAIYPLQILDASLWYSFFAVVVLCWSYQQLAVRELQSDSGGTPVNRCFHIVWEFLRTLITTQWYLFVAMPLLLMLSSNGMPLIAPVCNLLAVPLVSILIVPVGITAVLLSYIHSELAAWLLSIADWLTTGLYSFLTAVAQIQDYRLADSLPQLSGWQWSLLAIALSVVISGQRQPAYAAALLVWLISMFAPLGSNSKNIRGGELALTQFDVGQGSSLLISTTGGHWLYDTGARFSESYNAGQAVVIPYLKTQGINRIHTLLVSHGDNDHSGGVESIVQNQQIENLLAGGDYALSSELANRKDLHLLPCDSGIRQNMDGFSFNVLYPLKGERHDVESENDASCVLQISAHETNKKTGLVDEKSLLLIPGDISRKVEYSLMRRYRESLAAQMLVVAHHGSNSSTTASWLGTVSPDIALVSAGLNNRYQHPHPKVLKRLKQQGIPLYRSDELGAVQFRYQDGHWRGPYCHRYKARHFWHQYDNSEICLGPLPAL